jgi:hypothetical protein
MPYGAELRRQGSFKYGEYGLLQIVGHGGLLSLWLETRIPD